MSPTRYEGLSALQAVHLEMWVPDLLVLFYRSSFHIDRMESAIAGNLVLFPA